VEGLANLAFRNLPSSVTIEHPGLVDGQTDGEDSNTHPIHQQHCPDAERATVATQTESTSVLCGTQGPMSFAGSLPDQYIILHFGRCPRLFSRVLQSSRLGQNVLSQTADLTPSWANGAQILVPGLGPDDLQHNGHDPAALRPWHVVVMVEDVSEIFRSLQRLPYYQRPRAKTSMARRGFLKKSDASGAFPCAGGGFGASFVNRATPGKNTWAEPLRVVPSLSLNLPSLAMLDGFEEQELTLPQEGLEECASEPAAAIDKETADAICKAVANSFLEEHPCAQDDSAATGTMAMQVQKTFLHVPENLSCSHSPRTLVTV